MFARAIEIDPGYARAYAGLADCHSLLCAYWEASPEHIRAADAASRKVLELDPDDLQALGRLDVLYQTSQSWQDLLTVTVASRHLMSWAELAAGSLSFGRILMSHST